MSVSSAASPAGDRLVVESAVMVSLRLGIPAPIARSPISGWRVFARRRSAPGARSEVFTRADRAPSGSHGYSRPEVETRDRGDGRGTAFHARARMRAKRSDAVSKSGRRPGRPNNLLKFSRAWCAGPADDVFGGVRRALIHHNCARGGAPAFEFPPPLVACYVPHDARLDPRASARRTRFARPAVRESRGDPVPKARDVSSRVRRVGTTFRRDRGCLDAKRGFPSR